RAFDGRRQRLGGPPASALRRPLTAFLSVAKSCPEAGSFCSESLTMVSVSAHAKRRRPRPGAAGKSGNTNMATKAGAGEQPAPRPRRRLRAEERWEQILTVSAELFSSKGYHGASLDDIGERLGIQKAALYHYVRSKEDILVEIYDRMLTRAEAEVLPIADEPFAPDERLRRMVSRYIGLMIEQADMWSLIHYQQNALPAASYEATLR